MSADLKFWELQEAARSAIAASDFFTALPAVPVLAEDGTKHDTIEQALAGIGVSVEVWEPYRGDTRDQKGPALIIDSHVIVILRVHPLNNVAVGGANLKPLDAVAAILQTLAQRPRHPGGEFLRIEDPAWIVLDQDDGIRIYAMEFTKETTL